MKHIIAILILSNITQSTPVLGTKHASKERTIQALAIVSQHWFNYDDYDHPVSGSTHLIEAEQSHLALLHVARGHDGCDTLYRNMMSRFGKKFLHHYQRDHRKLGIQEKSDKQLAIYNAFSRAEDTKRADRAYKKWFRTYIQLDSKNNFKYLAEKLPFAHDNLCALDIILGTANTLVGSHDPRMFSLLPMRYGVFPSGFKEPIFLFVYWFPFMAISLVHESDVYQDEPEHLTHGVRCIRDSLLRIAFFGAENLEALPLVYPLMHILHLEESINKNGVLEFLFGEEYLPLFSATSSFALSTGILLSLPTLISKNLGVSYMIYNNANSLTQLAGFKKSYLPNIAGALGVLASYSSNSNVRRVVPAAGVFLLLTALYEHADKLKKTIENTIRMWNKWNK